jgi:phage baseplate assembly protein W
MNLYANEYALDIAKKVISDVDALDIQAISQSIESILMTEPNERIFSPNYGSFLSGIVFESLTSNSAEKLLDAIINLVIQYEKRITVISNLCSMQISQSQHSITLKLVYFLNEDQTPGQFTKKIVF